MIEQGSNEWHALRATRIGGSDASVIMGKNPWKTPLLLWKEKMGIARSPFQTDAMRRGTMLEGEARKLFIQMTGIPMIPEVFYNDWQIASLDGFNKQMGLVLEIKCPNRETHEKAKQGIIPEYYNIQMQHQFLLSETEKGIYFSFDGEKGIIVDVIRDDKFIEEMVKEEKEFYRKLKEFDPPDSPIEHRSDTSWKTAAEKLIEARRLKEMAAKMEEEAKRDLVSQANSERSEGFGVRLTKSITKGMIQYKNIPSLKEIDLEQFRSSPSERWSVFLI